MHVGVCRIELRLPENQSLKGKRRVIKSIIARLQNKYHVSVAEVDNQDLWQLATLGVACVSNHRKHADEILSTVVRFIAQNYPDVELLSSEIETLPCWMQLPFSITLLLCPTIDSRSSTLSIFQGEMPPSAS